MNRTPLPKSLFSDLNGTPVLLDREGKIIAQISSEEARVHVPVPITKMGKHLPKITIALEDHRYKAHNGIDFYAVFAAAYRTLTHTDHLSGASTISQQTIKLTNKRKGRSLKSKVRESLSALKLERVWNKEKILESYMNRLDYGNRRLGPEAAAWAYFGKPASTLTLAESIFIAGLPHSPTKYNPWLRPENANSKYLRSIKRLQLLGKLTKAQSERLADNPPLAHRELPPSSAPAFVEAMLKNNKNVSKNGPTLTTLDSSIQRSADDILLKQLNLLNRHSVRNAGMVVIENATGNVRAISSVSTIDGASEKSY
ncbi:MAG: transglycosylase domain-containing protein, partial [Verrucomicrobiota bacterium]|nr:transglycosylase domain-containing protein [Verrucomicrobiota bacterium]